MQKKSLEKTTTTTNRVAGLATSQPVATAVATRNTLPTHQQIAKRAYEIYVARGQTAGHELEDWVQAERELFGTARR